MKFLNRLLLAGALSLAVARAEVPSIIANGFEAYKATGSKDALTVWLRGAQPSVNINTAGMPPDLGPSFDTPGAFGPMESYDIIAVYSPTLRLRRVYAVAYFPQGPLFCCFDLFRNSGVWTTYGLKFNLSPDQVLPVDLIEKSG